MPADRPAPQAERWTVTYREIGGKQRIVCADPWDGDEAAWLIPDAAPLPPAVVERALAQHAAERICDGWAALAPNGGIVAPGALAIYGTEAEARFTMPGYPLAYVTIHGATPRPAPGGVEP